MKSTIELNFFALNLKSAIRIRCIEYKFNQYSINNSTLKIKHTGRNFNSKIDAKMRRHGAAHGC